MKDIKFLIEKPIAHRGLHSEEIAENSLIAFSRAIDAGYPIELDVQLTADEKLVVIHDWTLDRMTGMKGEVSKTKYEDIKMLTLNESKQKILLFEDVLNLVGNNVAIIVEIKSRSYFDFTICEKVYEKLNKYDGEYAISSFNPFVVKWFEKNAPEIVRGQNFTNFGNYNFIIAFCRKIFMYISWLVSSNDPDFFACRASMLPKCFPARIAQKNKKSILTYAITGRAEYDSIKHVIDNEFFDNKPFIKYEQKGKSYSI